jgi:hypothetical protein
VGERIAGTAGNDRLVALAGGGTLSGLAGNDAYIVNNAADMVVEAAGDGNDTVWVNVDYTLAPDAAVEALRAHAATGLRLAGNDTLIGGAGVVDAAPRDRPDAEPHVAPARMARIADAAGTATPPGAGPG